MSEEFWSGEFGDQYLARNRVDWQARIPFWKAAIKETGARSVYERGCNAGWNLSAIRRAYPDIVVSCQEINEAALSQSKSVGLDVTDYIPVSLEIDNDSLVHGPGSVIFAEPKVVGVAELVFTAGVLIHIPSDELSKFMQEIIDLSTDYVLAIEYAAFAETEVEYRGHSGKLWKRPYGMLYQNMGLTLADEGQAQGFDDCHYWLFRK